MDIFYALLGLTILLVAGDLLVRGAVNVALRLGVPALIVSLTVVAFGTSAPELIISVQAVLENAPGIALGNVVGSNTANVLLVLGLPALLRGLTTGGHDTRKSYYIMLGSSLFFIALCFIGPLVWWHGLLLLAVLGLTFLDQASEYRSHRRNHKVARAAAAQAAADAAARARENGVEEEEDAIEGADPEMRWWKISSFLVAGLIGLPLGADLFVDASVNIALALGVSQTVIGLTLVALGTSLPELATTLMAALRDKADVALGNVIGSNMFNLLAIIGVATLFGPIPVDTSFLTFDLWIMLAASLLLVPFAMRSADMSKLTGGVFTLLYVAYISVVLFWGI